MVIFVWTIDRDAWTLSITRGPDEGWVDESRQYLGARARARTRKYRSNYREERGSLLTSVQYTTRARVAQLVDLDNAFASFFLPISLMQM